MSRLVWMVGLSDGNSPHHVILSAILTQPLQLQILLYNLLNPHNAFLLPTSTSVPEHHLTQPFFIFPSARTTKEHGYEAPQSVTVLFLHTVLIDKFVFFFFYRLRNSQRRSTFLFPILTGKSKPLKTQCSKNYQLPSPPRMKSSCGTMKIY